MTIDETIRAAAEEIAADVWAGMGVSERHDPGGISRRQMVDAIAAILTRHFAGQEIPRTSIVWLCSTHAVGDSPAVLEVREWLKSLPAPPTHKEGPTQ